MNETPEHALIVRFNYGSVRTVLESCSFMRGAWVTKRYGPPEDGVRESTLTIAP